MLQKYTEEPDATWEALTQILENEVTGFSCQHSVAGVSGIKIDLDNDICIAISPHKPLIKIPGRKKRMLRARLEKKEELL